MSAAKKPSLCIIGSGWAGYSLAKSLSKSGKYSIFVVSPTDHFLFTPLLPSVTTGSVLPEHIKEPVREIPGVTFYQAYATDVDLDQKKVQLTEHLTPERHVYDIEYDKLVVATGTLPNDFGVPGVKENAFFLKTLQDSRNLRDRLVHNFEVASQTQWCSEEDQKTLLSVVVCGAGPTGVELSSDLHEYLTEDFQKRLYPHLPPAKVTLIEASNQVLSQFKSDLREFSEKTLKAYPDVDVKMQCRVTRVTPTHVETEDGSKIPCGCCVWSAGLAPCEFSELVRDASLGKTQSKLNEQPTKMIPTDEYLRVPGLEDVYAMGDCAAVSAEKGGFLPATAQVAAQQAKWLSQHFKDDSKESNKPFVYHHQGMLAYLGDRQGISDAPYAPSKGFWAWVLWKSAYATMCVSNRNKLLVPFDWLYSAIFGRRL